ncbi:hypothetical protein YO5_18192 [Stutzerimonas stutzeri TS44]|nr:hypothetical protein YO5_18192 [Stutzerimonas stutzeri TS44]
MKIKIALVVLALVALVGCGETEVNKVMPKAATTDAVYSENASKYLEEAIGAPKAKRIEMTFWHEADRKGVGYLSLIVDGVETIRPIDNIGGYSAANSKGFKFIYENGNWKAYVAEAEAKTHGDHPQEFFNKTTGILRKY